MRPLRQRTALSSSKRKACCWPSGQIWPSIWLLWVSTACRTREFEAKKAPNDRSKECRERASLPSFAE
eukprot:3494539-Prymnesium_polylepis.1